MHGAGVEEFILLGHDCPYGRYPAPVVPIGRLGGRLVAVYPVGDVGSATEAIDEDAEFVLHGPELGQKLVGFDRQAHRLFAYAPDEVEYYPAAREQEFLRKLLSQNMFHCVEGRFQLVLARRT
jgi:hypothetical protein